MRIVELTKNTAVKFWNDESGASLLEYAVLLGLITATAVASIGTLGGWVSDQFSELHSTLTAPPSE